MSEAFPLYYELNFVRTYEVVYRWMSFIRSLVDPARWRHPLHRATISGHFKDMLGLLILILVCLHRAFKGQ